MHILPRFCLENYFIDPTEIWLAFPAAQQQKISGGQAQFDKIALADLEAWLRHGALWHTINPLWEGLRGLGFKEALLTKDTAQDEAKIRDILRQWHDFLDPLQIFEAFQQNLQSALDADRQTQLHQWIHGKSLFQESLVPTLNQLFGQHPARFWRIEIQKALPIPDDLKNLLKK